MSSTLYSPLSSYQKHGAATAPEATRGPREPAVTSGERARVDSGIVHLQLVLTYFHWDLGIADSESEEAPRRDHP